MPYDRDKTTMDEFKLCNPCKKEYINPLDRRFHAQPNACKECGPKVWVEGSKGKILQIDNPIEFTANKLREGKIFAIKGVGGFNLVCDASNEQAVALLEKGKREVISLWQL